MSKGKNHNSILFLTTIGVYLGLVLVGGTAPQVFAHSATTRNFEISEEIEVKDDLDRKPDADAALEQFASSLVDIYKIASELSAADPKGVKDGRYNFQATFSISRGHGRVRVQEPDCVPNFVVRSDRYSSFLTNLFDTFLPRTETRQLNFRVHLSHEPDAATFGSTVIEQNPEFTAAASAPFFESLIKRKELESTLLKRLIYNSTEVSVRNDALLIVTRLPRGSIDPLLATNAG